MAADTPSGGMTGTHPTDDPYELLIGPSTSGEFNAITLRPLPIACWKIEDIRFAFDSSFVTPDAIKEFQQLRDLRIEHSKKGPPNSTGQTSTQYPPISVWGHADPVGPAVDPDGYNKSLSGRRAAAVYALLIVNTDPGTAAGLWRQIASTENWGSNQQQMMQANVTGGATGDLMTAYMKGIVPSDLALTSKDFLSSGTDSKGKYQGCSSFNPVKIFSQQKETRYETAKQNGDQPGILARNQDNAPNRRVLVLLFKLGSVVDPSLWPCPRASEGYTACKNRFWIGPPDGETRRTTRKPNDDRLFEKGDETFACRFYERITDQSPCHKVPPPKPCQKLSFGPTEADDAIHEVIVAPPQYPATYNQPHDWHAKFTVIVTRDPCQIRVIVKIKLVGAITDAQKQGWKSAIENKWNGKVTLYCTDIACKEACPDGYPVVINVDYVTSGQHQAVNVVPQTISMNDWSPTDTVDVTHEFGHMLGNCEEYFITNGVNYWVTVNGVLYPYRAPNGNIMNNTANDPVAKHYEMIRKWAGIAMGVSCSFTKPTPDTDTPPQPGDYEPQGGDTATV